MKKLPLILLLFPILLFGQENQPATQLAAEGITFNAGDYDVPEATDATYTTTYYIDPVTGLASNNGLSAGSPKASINDLASSEIISLSNTAFLWKKGTYDDQGSKKITFTGNNILLGAYGTGNKPQLTLYNFFCKSNNFVFRDMHFINTTVWTAEQTVSYVGGWIYNCEIEREQGYGGVNEGGLLVFGAECKVIYNVIHGQSQDGIYAKGSANGGYDNEYGYNYIYDVNRDWFTPAMPSGDCLQLSGFMNNYIHHNIMDRHTTGFKFCLILSDGVFFYGDTPMTSLVEYNVFYAPTTDADYLGVHYGGAGVYWFRPQECIFRYNKMISVGFAHRTTFYCSDVEMQGLEIYGNITIGGLQPLHIASGNKVYNNTFYNSSSISTGNFTGTFVSNNIFDDYDSRFDDGTNLFADIEGWGNLVTDASNDDFSLIPSSPAINAATWDGSNMDSDFTEDMEGTAVVQSTNNFDIGALQYAVAGACDGVNIYFKGTVSPDTAGRGIGSISQTITGNGTPPYTFLWDDSNTSEDRTGLTSGTYSVTITDDNECTNDTSYVINNITSVVDGNVIIDSVYATDWQDPYVPDNVLDNNNLTRLSSDDNSATLTAYISETSQIDSFSIYFDNATRVNNGAVQCYYDGNPQGVVNFSSDSLGVNLQYFSLNQVADSLVFYLLGNNQSLWTSWNELDLFGSKYYPPAPAGSAFQVNFGTDTITGWYNLNASSLSVTDGTYTASYGGYSTTTGGAVNGEWNDTVSQTYTERDGSGTSIDVTVSGMGGTLSSLELYLSTTTSYVFVNIYIEGVLVTSGYQAANNTNLITYTNVSVTGDLDISILETNSADKTIINALRIIETADSDPCDTTTIVTTETITNVDCYAANTGKITTSTIGGVTPYTYLWSSGETVDSIYNKPSGEYSITVTDTNGCIGIQSFTITQPDFSVATGEYTNPTCYGYTDGTATITITGGTAPWVVYWDSLGIYGDTVTNIGDNQGYYTATDANGCVLKGNTSTYNPDPIIDNYDNISKDYDNKQATGTILLNPYGGTGQLTYEWNNGYTNYDRTGLRPGGYTISITDDNGCIQNYEYVIKYVYSPYNKTKAKISGGKALIKNGKIKL